MNEAQRTVRRLLLDGVKIVAPYQRLIRDLPDFKTDSALQKEAALMELWVNMARTVALKLKKESGQTVTAEPK